MPSFDRLQGKVFVWIVDVSGNLNRYHYNTFLPFLNHQEQRAYPHFSLDRMPSIVGHALARVKIAELLSIPHEEVEINWSQGSAPTLHINGQEYFLSLSHSDNYVACAFSAVKVGVDVEEIEANFIFKSTSDFLFSQTEKEDLERLPPSKQSFYFHQLWTLKEAFCKATGLPLFSTADMAQFRIADSEEVFFCFEGSQDVGLPINEEQWQFLIRRPSPRHILSLAVGTGEPVEIKEMRVSLESLGHNKNSSQGAKL